MAERSFPFDSNPDSTPQETYEEDFSRILLHAVGDGTRPSDLVAVLSGTSINVQPGRALCRGYGYVNTDILTFPVPLNTHNSLHRADRIFLRLTKDTNQVRLVYVEGTPTNNMNDPTSPFPGNQPQGPIPTQTENTWDVYMYYVLVPPNESAAIQLHDERTFSIVSPSGLRSGMHAHMYEESLSEGQQTFIRGINFWPHWRYATREGLSEFHADGPRRHLRKASDATFLMDGNYRRITGWSTLDQARQSQGLGITLSGGGLRFNYGGFYQFNIDVSFYGGNGGRRTIRLRNVTRNTTLYNATSQSNYVSQTNSVSLHTERYIHRNDIIELQIAGLGGGNATVSTFGTFWLSKYITSGRVVDDA